MTKSLIRILTLLILALNCSCREVDSTDLNSANQNSSTETSLSEPRVIAVAYPLQYLTQRIVGATMTIECPVPIGQSASHWRPDRDDILRMQRADLIIANGLGAKLATWMDTASIPDSKICNSAMRGLSLRDFIAVNDTALVHSHGPGGEHTHSTTVPFTWLDPAMADGQAAYITQELTRVFPEHSQTFRENLKRLQVDLNALSQKLATLSFARETKPWTVYTTNPDLKYFTRAAGLEDRHLKWFEAPEPEVAVSELTDRLKNEDQRSVLTVDDKTVLLSTYAITPELEKSLTQPAVVWVQIDLLDIQPPAESIQPDDYLSVMQKNIERISSIAK